MADRPPVSAEEIPQSVVEAGARRLAEGCWQAPDGTAAAPDEIAHAVLSGALEGYRLVPDEACEECGGAGAFDFEGRPDPHAPELCTVCGGQPAAHQAAVEVLRQWDPEIMLGEANAIAQRILTVATIAQRGGDG